MEAREQVFFYIALHVYVFSKKHNLKSMFENVIFTKTIKEKQKQNVKINTFVNQTHIGLEIDKSNLIRMSTLL